MQNKIGNRENGRGQSPVSSLPSRNKRWHQWLKITQKQISKFSKTIKFCLISWNCFLNFVRDCQCMVENFKIEQFFVKTTFHCWFGLLSAIRKLSFLVGGAFSHRPSFLNKMLIFSATSTIIKIVKRKTKSFRQSRT